MYKVKWIIITVFLTMTDLKELGNHLLKKIEYFKIINQIQKMCLGYLQNWQKKQKKKRNKSRCI